MKEPNILTEIRTCPRCGSFETLGQRIAREMHRKEEFTALRKEIIPLTPPHLAVIYAKHLVLYHDTCLSCGTSFLTRAEIIEVPVKGREGLVG